MINTLENQIIFILDDDKDVTKMLEEFIIVKIPNLNVFVFNNYDDMVNHNLIEDCSLFIIDIELESSIKGNEVADELFKNKLNKPYLFMSGKSYNFEDFNTTTYTYDFIKKPFNLNELLNRIVVLLKVSKTYKHHENEEEKLRNSIKELFDYTNMYMIILDDNMKINSCSYALAKSLEYNNPDELLGLSWNNFLTKEESERIILIHQNIIDNTEIYKNSMREVSYNLITKSGTPISVRWFNSRIKNGHTHSFSIGIPLNEKITSDDEIDSIRTYWKRVIDKDEATLKSFKSLT